MAKKMVRAGVALSLACFSAKARANDPLTLENNIISSVLSNGIPSTSTATTDLGELNANGSFTDVAYSDTGSSDWGPMTHVDQLHDMAEVWADPSSSLYQSSTLEAGILSAYNYWVTNNYQAPNWWFNDIGVPDSLSETMLILQQFNALPTSNFNAGIGKINAALAVQPTLSATNLMWTAYATVNEGVLEYLAPAGASNSSQSTASTLIQNSFNAIGSTFKITTSDGIQADYSYHAHGPLLYDGGYGQNWLVDAAQVAGNAAGTAYGISKSSVDLTIDYILNGPQFMVRGVNYDLSTLGRDWSRPDQTNLASPLLGTVQRLIALDPSYRDPELVTLENRLSDANTTGAAESSNTAVGNRQFWESDYMVQQTASYMISVKTLSTRTDEPESINEENLKGVLGYSGANFIYQTGNEYNNIEPVWDWYRIPGTTTERSSTGVGGSYSLATNGSRGLTNFAGGASNGTLGATGFQYNQLNVSANKSWFLFSKEEVAMGNSIDAPNAGATDLVGTNINQTLLNGATVTYSTAAGQSTVLPAARQSHH